MNSFISDIVQVSGFFFNFLFLKGSQNWPQIQDPSASTPLSAGITGETYHTCLMFPPSLHIGGLNLGPEHARQALY